MVGVAAVGRLRSVGVAAVCAVVGAACTVPGPGGSGATPGCPGGQLTIVDRSAGASLDGARAVSPDGDSVVTIRRASTATWQLTAWATSGTPTPVATLDHPADGWPAPRVELGDDGVVHLWDVTAAHPFGLRWDPATGTVSEPVAPTVAVPSGATNVELRYVGPSGDGQRLLWAQKYRPEGSGDVFRVTQVIETDNRTDDVLAVQELPPLTGEASGAVGVLPGSENGRFVLRHTEQKDQFLPNYGDVRAQMVDMATGAHTPLSGAMDVIPNLAPSADPFGLFPQVVSPDGRYVAFIQQNLASFPAVSASLFLWDVVTSEAHLVTRSLATVGNDYPRRPVAVADDGVVTFLRLTSSPLVTPASYQLVAWDVSSSTARTIRSFTDPTALPVENPLVDLAGGGASIVTTELAVQPPNDSAVALICCG